MAQLHICIGQAPAAFAVVAGRTGRHHVCPDVRPAQVAWNDVVDSQIECVLSAVLAGIAIPPENLTAGQFDAWAGTVDQLFQPDDGRPGKNGVDRF